ncbi:MAG: SDR family NAD(P)-dependent oxidoreductase [Alphaproteobacteria bacterium]|nr:MAG: SDR family NAD(P)-dependent oxidoreductase [Alphaproteobacteria bacterium]
MQKFEGRTAVITGGASGIGLETAKKLGAKGMNLVLADIEQSALDKATADFNAQNIPVLGVRTDVGELADVQNLADQAWDRFGGVHVLFSNAGVAVHGALQDMTHADWEWSIKVNLWGAIHGVECFASRMIEQGEGGHIVNTASFAGLVPNRGLGVYCVTKYGVVALSECLGRDLREFDIGVSVLCPMMVHTNIGDSARNRPDEFGGAETLRKRTAEEQGDLKGGHLAADVVADMVVDGIANNKPYIITHEESREFIRRRFERIDQSFEVAE